MNYDPPWLRRVAELHSNTAANVDAERQVVKLNEDVRELVREMRIKVRAQKLDGPVDCLSLRTVSPCVLGSITPRGLGQDRAHDEATRVGQEASGRVDRA